MKLNQLLGALNRWAPFTLQESYDNSGLLVGDPSQEIEKILISLDITEEIIEEAIQGDFDLIISHHPVIFKGLKSLTGKTPEERVVMKAIKHDIAIMAIHTNLDNVMHGVNAKIAEKLGIQNFKILLSQKGSLKKLAVYIPKLHLEEVRQAIFQAGAGHIGNYENCSFGTEGTGTFKGNKNSNPFVGKVGQLHDEAEVKFETIFPAHIQGEVISALLKSHPYEEVAYDIYQLENKNDSIGAGIIGELPEEMEEGVFLSLLKEKMDVGCVRHTSLRQKPIKKVALCGGSGSFLIGAAKASHADIYISGDIKYHEFFEANEQFIIADIGHYESEQFTKVLIADFLIENFPKFAVQISEHQTNPINYF
ncbi:Nif3-like dinuclear metal center hexameric protein [Lentimicrobium sp. L6]|nr:Nif3-like dinuclear metal center hexameric protein [Lentimicrobium sp. S6]NPD85836.1 Nif3-like dinuclear metal center hexameric protein [Lentimicrobium sp. L6]